MHFDEELSVTAYNRGNDVVNLLYSLIDEDAPKEPLILPTVEFTEYFYDQMRVMLLINRKWFVHDLVQFILDFHSLFSKIARTLESKYDGFEARHIGGHTVYLKESEDEDGCLALVFYCIESCTGK
jgi:hypothetical protein